jgi:hypothetical protein
MARFPTGSPGLRLLAAVGLAALPLVVLGGCDNQPTQQVSSGARAKLSGEPAPSDSVDPKVSKAARDDGTIKGRLRGGAGRGGL